MAVKKHIPNFLTLCNLLCGFTGVLLCLELVSSGFAYGEYRRLAAALVPVVVLVYAALAFDFLDGFAARKLNVTSAIGKELDSLADLVTFGVLPGIILYLLIKQVAGQHTWWAYSSVLVPAFSALRLAKFNVDDRQTYDFYGMPTPANALLITSLPMIMQYDQLGWAPTLLTFPVLVVITVISSLLLVVPVRLIAFKFRDYSWKNNRFKYIHFTLFVVLLITVKFYAIPLTIVLYILLSLLRNLTQKEEAGRA